jgi:hypothetical protein
VIVVDLGCETYGEVNSVAALIDRFQPRLFFGFDPLLGEPVETPGLSLRRLAACTHAGATEIGVGYKSNWATIVPERGLQGQWNLTLTVPCFNFPLWVQALALAHPNDEVVVKMDIEGSEYQLLDSLIELGVDRQLKLLLVEWHELPDWMEWRDDIMRSLHCPLEDWE